MAFRLNNGRGAITCDRCYIIMREYVDFREEPIKHHFCPTCVRKRLTRMLRRRKMKRLNNVSIDK